VVRRLDGDLRIPAKSTVTPLWHGLIKACGRSGRPLLAICPNGHRRKSLFAC
jgi:hypothetical protein